MAIGIAGCGRCAVENRFEEQRLAGPYDDVLVTAQLDGVRVRVKPYVNSASRLDDVASGLAQHRAHVAEPIPGLAEQLWSLADVHRGVVRHSGDRQLELTDLVGDGLERLEVNLGSSQGLFVGLLQGPNWPSGTPRRLIRGR